MELSDFSIGKCYFNDGSVEDIRYLEHYSESVITFHTDSGRYMYATYGIGPDIETTLADKYASIRISRSDYIFEKHDYDPFIGPIVSPANIDHIEILKSIIDFYNEHRD